MTRYLHLAFVLGLITAVGPFAIDMFLPALPMMGEHLHATPAAMQMTLTAYFVVIGICQLAYGPLSDIVGRKPPIYGGLAIFAAGSIGCALANSVEMLVVFRVVQAFGACAGMVIPRAIVRDLHTGPDATRMMSMLMLVVSISPVLAPLTGSLVSEAAGWRGIFWTLAGAALIGLILAMTQLKETRHADHRADSSWMGALRGYRLLMTDPTFLGLVFVGAFGISAFFVYIGSASYVFIEHFKLSPTLFSLCFALNAASFFGCSQFTGYLTERYGLPPVVRIAVTGFALSLVIDAILMNIGVDSVVVMMVFLFIGYGLLGLVIPTTAVLALDQHGAIAGTASALMGALQMILGAVIMSVAGLFADGTPTPMMIGIAGCAVAAFSVTMLVLKPTPKAVPAAAE